MRITNGLLALPLVGLLFLFLSSCTPNNPYRESESGKNIVYADFDEEPKDLDPAKAYTEDAYIFMCQVYEPVVQYHYLARPFTIVPLTCESVPTPRLLDKDGKTLPETAADDAIASVVYEIKLKKGIKYQDHACFAKGADGKYTYHLDDSGEFPKIEHPDDLAEKGTRELLSDDYIYQIKRLANPVLQCPIFEIVGAYIDGLPELRTAIAEEIKKIRKDRREKGGIFYNQESDERLNPIYIDYRKFDLPGVKKVDDHTYQLILKKRYPQMIYWLAMPFFSPVPWEADRFFFQPAAAVQNITLNRFLIGTGPYTLAVSQANFRMVLSRNQNYRGEPYPSDMAESNDQKAGRLADAGKMMPFIDQAVFSLEKEAAPRWTKFLQGYYDASGIGSDNFDQVVSMGSAGGLDLTDEMQERGIRLTTTPDASTSYWYFNMMDDVVGGYEPKKKKLRQALSIALNFEEFIQIFMNGRATPAMSPIPEGLFGHQEGKAGINPYVYNWDEKANAPVRKSLDEAKKLLAEAGYPNGRGPDGKQLVIYYDTMETGGEMKPRLTWMIRQFEAIGVQLQIRATDYNRFQAKMDKGNFQFARWGWNADYPDPENFFFLLNGANARVDSHGENTANYKNPEFDKLFKQMENMPSGPERLAIIEKMLAICRDDAPWMFGFHTVKYSLSHAWSKNSKPMVFGNNFLKYRRVDVELREKKRAEWNSPVWWPVWVALGVLVASAIPAAMLVYRRERGAPTA